MFFLFSLCLAEDNCPFISDKCTLKYKNGTDANPYFKIEPGVHCEFKLTNCDVGSCYYILDQSYKYRFGNPRGSKYSIFSEFNAWPGLTNWKASTISFRAYASIMSVNFTTKDAKEFYQLHPEAYEDSNNPVLITQLGKCATGACDDL